MSMFLATLLLLVGSPNADTNNALTLTQKSFDAVWTKGIADGAKRKDQKKGLDLSEKVIDRYHYSTAGKSACSWAYFLHPKMLVRLTAWQAASQYWTEQEMQKAKDEWKDSIDKEPETLAFYVELTEMPSFAGLGRKLSRRADPDNLTDIRCVLKVGDRVIQPTKQPGDLTISESDEMSVYLVPQVVRVNGTTSSTATAHAPGVTATAEGRSTSSYTVSSIGTGSQSYSVYKGSFVVFFPLRNEKGELNVRPEDKELKLVVVKKSAELTAVYKLSDWVSALE